MDDDREPITPALAGYTGFLLARAYIRARGIAKSVLPRGRHASDLSLIGLLVERGPVSQRELGDKLGINRTFMVKMIDRLEASGLARRERNPADRRSYAVVATDAGRASMAELNLHARRGEATLVQRLAPEEHERLDELLGALLPPGAEPPQSMAARTGYLLAINHIRLREQGRSRMRATGMEPRTFGVLTTLAEIEPCSQRRLATELGISGPAIVGIVDELHRTGRIERERNPDDRREHVLRLTAKGRADLAESRRTIEEIHGELAHALGRDGLDELNALLLKILS